mmetsp:Transcript_15998/g.44036  ORF Transcript_15998/g.44036 Transcript_15998/m.44036 type:complete len:109 (+) Transcript_15998:31-357(+)
MLTKLFPLLKEANAAQRGLFWTAAAATLTTTSTSSTTTTRADSMAATITSTNGNNVAEHFFCHRERRATRNDLPLWASRIENPFNYLHQQQPRQRQMMNLPVVPTMKT